MIIVKIHQGLGNQLFQYALARKMSLKNKDIFKLDISSYTAMGSDTPREYSLKHFNIIENIATPEEVRRIKLPYGILSSVYRWFEKHVLRVFNIEFKPEILNKKGDMYLDGLWQSEKYFSDIREVLIKEFSLKQPLGGEATSIAEQIKKTPNSVSLHVRRGDYVYNPISNAYLGTCSLAYYVDALTFLKKRLETCAVFVFSDDLEWVKTHMVFDVPVIFVSNLNIADYEELV
ncbi:MAG: alpha-1,2-fucosyltransferase, partial [Minisyncoccia bacterium]